MTGAPILAIDRWPTNGHLIADVAALGLLRADVPTIDPTWGGGVFWRRWRPEVLIGSDIDPARTPGAVTDFRRLPWADGTFGQAVYDPGYKLNGTPSGADDVRYGVGESARWEDRIELMLAGFREVRRVVGPTRRGRRTIPGVVAVKCKDQVVSGRVRWQTRLLEDEADKMGLGLVARFDFLARRPQPDDEHRRQRNPRSCSSQLLVFREEWTWRP